MFRLIVPRSRAARTPVTECGYRNRGRAEPSASVAYCNWPLGPRRMPSPGLGDFVNLASAAEKTDDLRPVWHGSRPPGGCRREDRRPAAELGRDVEHRDDDDEVDQRVLDEGDQRRSAQARVVRV